jgi:CMP-N,N'-diacetyllegionaminic acid synthase
VIAGKRVLGLITARGGSKGVPRKNLRVVGGKPLIAWTIEAGRCSAHIDHLVLSSDDAEIIAAARAHGCEAPFVRPAELATDTAASLDVARDAIARVGRGFHYLVLLQPTSPLRASQDIDQALQLCEDSRASTCVSVCEVDKSPYWMVRVADDQRISPLLAELPPNRQSAPKVYILNGAVYVARCDHLMGGGDFIAEDTVARVMPKERSIDIDSEEDIVLLEHRLGLRK